MQNNQPKYNYERKMKEKGFVKACFWINPADFDAIQRKCEISREKKVKK